MENEQPDQLQDTLIPAAPVFALFASASQARKAMVALGESGVPASAISVAEAQPGVGIVCGLATTLTPGSGPYAWSGPYSNLYPAALGGSFNPAIVETPDRASLAMTLVDLGLTQSEAEASAEAVLAGAVFVAVSRERAEFDVTEIGRVLTLNGGKRLTADH